MASAGVVVSAAAAVFTWRQADEAFKQSDEYKIQQAVQKFMEPFKPSKPKEKVIQREVMKTIEKRLTTWTQHATIVSGRYQTGKTVAVQEVLRYVPGVWSLLVKDKSWEEKLYQSLGITGAGTLEEVLSRVQAKLAELPKPKTKIPIILLEVPRRTKEGRAFLKLSVTLEAWISSPRPRRTCALTFKKLMRLGNLNQFETR